MMNPARCPSGHVVPSTFPFCSTCGAKIKRSLRLWYIVGGAAAAVLVAIIASVATAMTVGGGDESPPPTAALPVSGPPSAATPSATPAPAAAQPLATIPLALPSTPGLPSATARPGATATNTSTPAPAVAVSAALPTTPTPPSAGTATATPAPPPTNTPTPAPLSAPTASPAAAPLPTPIPVPTLVSGITIEAALQFPGQVQKYSFEAGPDDVITIALAEGADMENTDFEIFDDLDARIDLRGYRLPDAVTTKIENPGRHTVRVSNRGLNTGSYRLSFYRTSQLPELTSGSTISSSIEFPGEIDMYSFEAGADEAVIMSLSEGSDVDMILEIFNPQGSPAVGMVGRGLSGHIHTYKDTSSDTYERILPDAGRYTVMVRASTAKAAAYQVFFYKASQGGGMPLIPNASVQAVIEEPGSAIHWYSLEAREGDNVVLVLQEGSDNQVWVGKMLDPRTTDKDGRLWNRRMDGWRGVSYGDLDVTAETTGTFLVGIWQYGNRTGPYTLSYSLLPP